MRVYSKMVGNNTHLCLFDGVEMVVMGDYCNFN